MSRSPIACVLVLAAAVATVGCAQGVQVRSDGPRGQLEVDGELVGEIGDEELEIGIGRGVGPVPYAIEGDDGVRYEGVIERDALNWWVLAPAVCSAAVCSPTLAASGALLANPLFPVVVLTTCSLASTTGFSCAAPAGVLANPSCLTLPLACAGGLLGLAPLAALPLADEVPAVVTLRPVAVEGEDGQGDAPATPGSGGDEAEEGLDMAPDASGGVSY